MNLDNPESQAGSTADESEDEMRDEPEESFCGDLTRFGRWLMAKRVTILVVFVWAVALALVEVREYNLAYSSPFAMDPAYRVAFAPSYSPLVPRLYITDYAVFLAASLLAGFAIRDIETVLYGFLLSILLSFSASVAYASAFIWYILDFGSVVDISFLTSVVWAAILTIFRMVFPLAVIAAFIGSITGSIIRDFLGH
jgi:hypothetical protein